MQPVYVSKSLNAASSNGIGSISTAVPSVVTLNTSDLDTGRRIVFYSTADASSLTLTFIGYPEGNSATTFSESVVGSTGAGVAATTTADFLSVSSVTFSSNVNIPILLGTSSVGGTPWQVIDVYRSPIQVAGQLEFSSSANGLTGRFDLTMDDPTGTWPNHPDDTVPHVFNSTSPIGIAASTNSIGNVSVDGNTVMPFYAWRLTITSSSSGAGSINAVALQSG